MKSLRASKFDVTIHVSSAMATLADLSPLLIESMCYGRNRGDWIEREQSSSPDTLWGWRDGDFIENHDDGNTIGERLEQLAKRFAPRIEACRDAGWTDIEVKLFAGVFAGEYSPAVELPPDLIELAAAMRAEIIIDFLTWPDAAATDVAQPSESSNDSGGASSTG
jgi:hypothetical protein